MDLLPQYRRFRDDIDPIIRTQALSVQDVKFAIGEAVHEALKDNDAKNHFVVEVQNLTGERPSRAVVTEDYGANLIDNLRSEKKRSGSTRMAYALYFTLHAKSNPLQPQYALAALKLDNRLLGLKRGFEDKFKWIPTDQLEETSSSWRRFVEKHGSFRSVEVVHEGTRQDRERNISDIAPQQPKRITPVAIGQRYFFRLRPKWAGVGLVFQVQNEKTYPLRSRPNSFSWEFETNKFASFPPPTESEPEYLVESGPPGLSQFMFLNVAKPYSDISLTATREFDAATEAQMRILNFLSKNLLERSAEFELLCIHLLFVNE
ncbi:MAG: hypothetical protein QNJ16_13050 [Rhodobacter sp.]|nr:hypothetical protein [Rhodobacter sp.]